MELPLSTLVLVLTLILLELCGASAAENKKAAKKTADPHDNKGLTPFFLQDPTDDTCLGPNGFTICDENALWLLTRRSGKKTYSLVSFLSPERNICMQQKKFFFGLFGSDRVVLGSCNTASAKAWKWDFVDQTMVKISSNGQCLVRGRKGFKNSVSLAPCGRDDKMDYSPLLYVATAVHENGFYLKSADGSCFDGARFRPCASQPSKTLFGLGLKYVWGEPQKYFFHFASSERANCVVAAGRNVDVGSCANPKALSWAVQHGQLSFQHGKQCVVRTDDNKAALAKCSEGSEYVALEVPSLASEEQQLQRLSPEAKALLKQALGK